MSREINPFGLRMQPQLRTKLEHAAQLSGRSLNSEISLRLEKSFEPSGPWGGYEMQTQVEFLAELIRGSRLSIVEYDRMLAKDPDPKFQAIVVGKLTEEKERLAYYQRELQRELQQDSESRD